MKRGHGPPRAEGTVTCERRVNTNSLGCGFRGAGTRPNIALIVADRWPLVNSTKVPVEPQLTFRPNLAIIYERFNRRLAFWELRLALRHGGALWETEF